MLERVHNSWQPLFDAYRQQLEDIFARLEGSNFTPEPALVFRAFELPPEHYRVLIMGQDPYPTPGHATGLAFCVPAGTAPLPPSLRNILRELGDDLGPGIVTLGDVCSWSAAGVMMLNRYLTTATGEIGAHADLGWAEFTQAAAAFLQQVRGPKLVALLWGSRAQELAPTLSEATLIHGPHPSPLSAHRGFFGSRPFSSCNKALLELGEEPIDWSC